MTTTAELQANPYRRGTRVRFVDNVRSYPAGSRGRIAVANGVTWRRYWVRMSDGEAIGHVDHGALVRAKDYDTYLAARQREAAEAAEADNAVPGAPSTPTDATGTAPGGAQSAGTVVNGVLIPRHLLERSAAARTRLSG